MNTRTIRFEELLNLEFYQFPKWLMQVDISNDARVIYMLTLDRFKLSLKNGWKDKDGNAFCFYKREEIADDACVSIATVYRKLEELKDAGLWEERKNGFNEPNSIYLSVISQNDSPNLSKLDVEPINLTPRTYQNDSPNLSKLKPNNNKFSNNKFNNNTNNTRASIYTKFKYQDEDLDDSSSCELGEKCKKIEQVFVSEVKHALLSPPEMISIAEIAKEFELDDILTAIQACKGRGISNFKYVAAMLRGVKKDAERVEKTPQNAQKSIKKLNMQNFKSNEMNAEDINALVAKRIKESRKRL